MPYYGVSPHNATNEYPSLFGGLETGQQMLLKEGTRGYQLTAVARDGTHTVKTIARDFLVVEDRQKEVTMRIPRQAIMSITLPNDRVVEFNDKEGHPAQQKKR